MAVLASLHCDFLMVSISAQTSGSAVTQVWLCHQAVVQHTDAIVVVSQEAQLELLAAASEEPPYGASKGRNLYRGN